MGAPQNAAPFFLLVIGKIVLTVTFLYVSIAPVLCIILALI